MKQPEDAPFDHGGRDGMVDLRGILLALRARLKTILAITFAVAIAATVFVITATPRFAAETQLLLENRDTAFTRTLSEPELPSNVIDEQAVLSQVQVVTSREVAREAIRRLGLVGNAEFDPLVGPMDPVTRVRTLFGIASGDTDRREEDRIFSAYYNALTVYNVPRSRVLAIEFRSEDPDLSARAANTIAEVYLEKLEEAQTELARAASDWLGENIEDLRARVAEAEAAVESFRSSSRLFLSGDNASISSQQLSDLNARLAEARSAQADSEARAQLINEMLEEGRAFEIPDVASNELIARLIEQRIDLRSQIALEQRTLLPEHPRILELRAQLADLDEQIRASAERTVRILENEASIAASRVASLEEALDAQMSVVAQANESEVQLRALEREARAEREQLENYLTRYREAIARGSQNATLPDARIVSRAVTPSDPVFPRKGPTIVLATLGAAFVATGGVVVAALVSGGSPAAPARAGGYGYAMQRRDIYADMHDDAYGDGRQAIHAGPGFGYAPMDFHSRAAMPGYAASGYGSLSGAAGAAAVDAARAGDHHSGAPTPPPIHARDAGHRGVNDSPDDQKQAPDTLIVDPAERPLRPLPEAFVEIPLKESATQEASSQESSLPPDAEVLSDVRKVGARLRGTLTPEAGGVAGQQDASARPVPRERIDAAVAPQSERPATDAPYENTTSEPVTPQVESPGVDSPHDVVMQGHEREPVAVAPEDSRSEENASPGDKPQEIPTRQPAAHAAEQEPEPESPQEPVVQASKAVADVDEVIAAPVRRTRTAKSDDGDHASDQVAEFATAPKQPLPDSWQELVAEAHDPPAPEARAEDDRSEADSLAEFEADAEAPPASEDVELKHEPRLRRKNASRAKSGYSRAKSGYRSEDDVQESRLDAAWHETSNTATPVHSPEAAAAPPPATTADASSDPVPVLEDGPPAPDSVPVPVNSGAHPQGASPDAAATGSAGASDHAEAAYDFSALLGRLRENQRQDRGQRVLISGLGDSERLRRFGEALAHEGAKAGRCILISTQDDGGPTTVPGLSDLIAERASFFDVIQRDPRSSLHRVENGRGDRAGLINDDDGLDIALTAFQHTYGLVFMLMPDPSDADLLRNLAGAADTIVVAADREADDPELVDLYARLVGMGTADVVVAGVGRRAGVVAA